MTNLLQKFLKKEIIIYTIIGGICAFIDLGAFYALNTFIGVSYLISHFFSVWLASTVKFFLNKFFTFKNKSKKVGKQYFSSLFVLGIYIIITEIFLYLFVELMGFTNLISKVFVLILGLAVNYGLDKKITFGIID